MTDDAALAALPAATSDSGRVRLIVGPSVYIEADPQHTFDELVDMACEATIRGYVVVDEEESTLHTSDTSRPAKFLCRKEN